MSTPSSAKYVRSNKRPEPKGAESDMLLGYFHDDIGIDFDEVISAVIKSGWESPAHKTHESADEKAELLLVGLNRLVDHGYLVEQNIYSLE